MTAPWWSAWAKTDLDRTKPGVVESWLPLHQHLADTAGVAERLVQEWVPSLVVRRIATDLGGDITDTRIVATWLAAVHDVGKLSPAFAVQAHRGAPGLLDSMGRHGLVVDPRCADDGDRARVRHEFVGQDAVRGWLRDELGFGLARSAAQFACVVGGHHGVPASREDLNLVRSRTDLAGTGGWVAARAEALGWATELVGGPDVLRRYADRPLGPPSQVLLTAIVIMADWIASNVEYFPLDPLRTAAESPRLPDPEFTRRRVERGWAAVDLPRRWTPRAVTDPVAAFGERFGRVPRPVQLAAVTVALEQPEPGMVVIEAPMGEGKTEAALLAAEVLAARSGADGCFVALPTRATTDAMFGRVLAWLDVLPGIPDAVSVQLAHGTATLNDEFRGLMRNAYVRGVGEGGDEAAIAHEWLRGRKRGPLAQFVVGTVDQVLFGGLKARHLMLRHLALAGKVVIIDEVHAYDVYMSRYLDRILHWLGAYGTPVVLLSATLPAARRGELVAAYESGRADGSPEPLMPAEPGYPVVHAAGLAPRSVPPSGSSRPVRLERLDEDPDLDDLDALVALLDDALADGGCAVVIRNTVTRVQRTAERLVEVFGESDVTITHSRFLACDRAELDRNLLRRFGPPGERTSRPARHVVVASQVVEQSLDVDFDLMVTDLAPVDLILQRMGRLHRHVRPRPDRLTVPRCVLTGVEDWSSAPIRAVRGSRAVYSEYTLLRAAALLGQRQVVTLPDDIAPLVQRAYGDDVLGPVSWQPDIDRAHAAEAKRVAERRSNAEPWLVDEVDRKPSATLLRWVHAGVGDADSDERGDTRRSGQVRDGAESVEVLVVQQDRDGGLLTPDWIPSRSGVQLPLDEEVPRDLARVVATCAVRLPPAMSQLNAVGDGVIAALERNHFTSFHQSPLLRGQLVLVLDEDRSAEVEYGPAAFRVTYDRRKGLLHEHY